MIKGTVTGQQLRLHSEPIASDSLNYLTAEFTFSGKDWDTTGLRKFISFSNMGRRYEVELDEEDKITEEMGLNLTSGTWTVGAFGILYADGGNEVRKRITTTTANLNVSASSTPGGEPFPSLSGSVGEMALMIREVSEANAIAAEQAADEAANAVDLAREAAAGHAPQIRNGTWWVWDYAATPAGYKDTKVAAQGPQGKKGDTGERGAQGSQGAAGVSPRVVTTPIFGPDGIIGHNVTITDKTGDHFFVVSNGEKGEKGDKGDPGETPGYDLLPTEQGSGSIVRTVVGADNVPVKAMEIAIQCVQPGSGDPSPDNVRPILGWKRIGIGSERASAADERYSGIDTQREEPWAYLASDGEVTYYSSLVDAYKTGMVGDNSYVVIVLLHDYTIRAADEYMTVNHVIARPDKNIVLDLNGHTLTNPTNRNLFYLDADNYSLTITSTNGQGKYVHTNEAAPRAGTNKRCLVAIGNTGATAADAARSVSVSISNVDVEVLDGSAFASYYASPKISLSNGNFSTPTSTMISMQSNTNWTASTIAKPEIALENITFNGSAFGWMNHFSNSSKTAAENSSLVLKFSGTNTINFTNAAYATQHGFQFRKRGVWISAFDPDNGFIQNAGNTIVSLNGAEPTGGGVYTVAMETPGPTMQIPLGRAVYGGTLNVLTGVLTITHKMTTLGDIDGWTFTPGEGHFSANLAAAAKQSSDYLCSGYKPLPDTSVEYVVYVSGGDYICVNDPDYKEDDGEEEVGDVSRWLNERAGDYQLVYELAQPETVQLTPQEVRTVLGANTFAADTGDVTVTLRVDPTLAYNELKAAILAAAE